MREGRKCSNLFCSSIQDDSNTFDRALPALRVYRNMNNVPKKLRKELAADPFYKACARKGINGHECAGRITWDHTIIFAGKQVQERFAIIPVCAKAHEVDSWQDGGELNKELHLWIALNRATDDELASISRAIDYRQKRDRLNVTYGVYREPTDTPQTIPFFFGINYSLR